MAQSFDLARFRVAQALLHLKTGVAHLNDAAFTHNRVVEMHRHTKVEVNVDKDIFEGQPVDFSLEDMLKVTASTHVEVVALRPVVDMVVGVKVAHSDLDGTREHIVLSFGYQIVDGANIRENPISTVTMAAKASTSTTARGKAHTS